MKVTPSGTMSIVAGGRHWLSTNALGEKPGAAVGIVASGGTLSAEAAGVGCASGVVVYDISQVNETAGQVGELVSGAKDIVDEFSSLFS